MSIENFGQLADYNHWTNRRLYAAALEMSDEQYRRTTGVFFGSLHGTLNHVARRSRVAEAADRRRQHPNWLDAILFDDRRELAQARMAEDARLKRVIGSYTADDLGKVVSYTMAEKPQKQALQEILLHLFNHQTHHRGQAPRLLFDGHRE